MNLFPLDRDPARAAQFHCDQHVRKMILEYAQLLTLVFEANHDIKSWILPPAPQTYLNNPCAVWVRASKANYLWTYELFVNLLTEFHYRWGVPHAYGTISVRYAEVPHYLPEPLRRDDEQDLGWAVHMPDDCRVGDTVRNTRLLYNRHKRFATWTRRPVPDWYVLPPSGPIS